MRKEFKKIEKYHFWIKLIHLQACFVLFALPSFSQVTIGKDSPPHTGAALELVSNNKKGLLLPQVALTSATSWKPVVSDQPVNGMMVFNTNDIKTPESGLAGIGAYVWTDGKWNILDNEDCPLPAKPGEITLSIPGSVDQLTEFTASITAVAGATSYIWELADGLMGFSNTTQITITPVKDGTYPAGSIRVKAVNNCGISEAQSITGRFVVNYVDPCGDCVEPGNITSVTLSTYNARRSDIITATVSPVEAGVDYYWQLPAGLSGQSMGPTISITCNEALTYPSGSIKVYAVKECGSKFKATTTDLTVNCPEPTVPNVAIYPNEVRGGNKVILYANSRYYATSYRWDLSNIGLSTIETTSNYLTITVPKEVNNKILSGSKIISVMAVNDCGTESIMAGSATLVVIGVVSCTSLERPNNLIISPQTVRKGDYITVTISGTTTDITKYYEWLYPHDILEAESYLTSNPSIRFKVLTDTSFNASEIVVIAKSNCAASDPRLGTGTITVTP